MANFQRDKYLSNLTINEQTLNLISTMLENRRNAVILGQEEHGVPENNAYLIYVIRFDDKGYRFFSLNDLSHHFQHAKKIERIVMSIETSKSISSSRTVGTYMEIWLDAVEPHKSYIIAASDDSEWVDSSYSAAIELLNDQKNRNGWVRTQWMDVLTQIFGVTLSFVFSIWAALVISPKISIENAFIISFMFALLIFSNTWTYLRNMIQLILNHYFPSISFYRQNKDRLHWFMQTMIGGMALGVTIYVLGVTFDYIGNFLATIVK